MGDDDGAGVLFILGFMLGVVIGSIVALNIDATIYPHVWEKAVETCQNNEGVATLRVHSSRSTTIQCNNGVTLKYTDKRRNK